MHCPLCGFTYDPDSLECSTTCPLAALQGCHLVCCPNCGYQIVDERKSGAAKLLRRWLKAEDEIPPAAEPPAREPDRPLTDGGRRGGRT